MKWKPQQYSSVIKGGATFFNCTDIIKILKAMLGAAVDA